MKFAFINQTQNPQLHLQETPAALALPTATHAAAADQPHHHTIQSCDDTRGGGGALPTLLTGALQELVGVMEADKKLFMATGRLVRALGRRQVSCLWDKV